ncbi:type II toxin-antitoxin system prevent-host-death family antitoxin [Candidatus Falkowbacteria bacterium]|nr:type II toxin-antitoxin system prevent-host-death family antitoxin [Candidatus Falkowbacteria bacterium]
MKTKKVTKKISEKQATHVRQNFQEVIDQVHYTREAMLITKHNKPWVMIEPLEE